MFGSLIGKVLKKQITILKGLAKSHFDACKKLKNRLAGLVASAVTNKASQLKIQLLLKYYGVDDEGALSKALYDSPKGNLKFLSKKERDQ